MYFNAIAKVVSDRTGREVSEVKPESTFAELGIDSLDIVEMVMDLESELGIELDMEDQKIATFGELAEFIESKLN